MEADTVLSPSGKMNAMHQQVGVTIFNNITDADPGNSSPTPPAYFSRLKPFIRCLDCTLAHYLKLVQELNENGYTETGLLTFANF